MNLHQTFVIEGDLSQSSLSGFFCTFRRDYLIRITVVEQTRRQINIETNQIRLFQQWLSQVDLDLFGFLVWQTRLLVSLPGGALLKTGRPIQSRHRRSSSQCFQARWRHPER